MNVKQLDTLLATVESEVLGSAEITVENLTDVVDFGVTVFNNGWKDKYTNAMVNTIGKMVFVNRTYRGKVPSVLMDDWTYGSIVEKISVDIPEATENSTWELTDGQSIDPFVVNLPTVNVRFFNKLQTFEVDNTISDKLVEQSLRSRSDWDAFAMMLFNVIENKITLDTEQLIMRTINNFIGESVQADYGNDDALGAASHNRAVNLLYLYNQETGNTLTAAKALSTPEFIRYASIKMGLYRDHLNSWSKLFNISGKARFTPEEDLRVVLLSNFEKAARGYLYSDTFHNGEVMLPKADIVPFWQGTGTDYGFDSVSAIHVNTSEGHEISMSGILGVMFDYEALGVNQHNRRTTTQYNAKGEYTNYFHKVDARYFSDPDENFIVFFIADAAAA